MEEIQTTQTEQPSQTTATGTPDDPIFVTNLSVRALGCRPGMVGDKPLLIARIYGLANDIKTGEDKRSGNTWTALTGEFVGVNLQEGLDSYGKTFRSGKLFLPQGIQEVVEKAVNEYKKDASAVASVRFALELYSAPANNASKYTYQAKNILKVEAVDPLNELANALPPVGTTQKAIDAPKEAPKPEKKKS